MAPSAVTTENTALQVPSGDGPRKCEGLAASGVGRVRGGPLSWPDLRATIPESSSSTSRRGVPRDDGLEAEGADGEPQQLDAPGRLEGRAVDVAGRARRGRGGRGGRCGRPGPAGDRRPAAVRLPGPRAPARRPPWPERPPAAGGAAGRRAVPPGRGGGRPPGAGPRLRLRRRPAGDGTLCRRGRRRGRAGAGAEAGGPGRTRGRSLPGDGGGLADVHGRRPAAGPGVRRGERAVVIRRAQLGRVLHPAQGRPAGPLARLHLGARPAGPALARLGDAPRAVRRFPPLRGERRPAGRGAVGDVRPT